MAIIHRLAYMLPIQLLVSEVYINTVFNIWIYLVGLLQVREQWEFVVC